MATGDVVHKYVDRVANTVDTPEIYTRLLNNDVVSDERVVGCGPGKRWLSENSQRTAE
jgi:hypothetical protein